MKLSWFVLACTGALAITGCGGVVASQPSTSVSTASAGANAVTSLTPIKLAYSQVTAGSAPTYVASDLGFFQKHGLQVSIVQVAGPQEVPALIANEIQIGAIGGNELVDADLGGASLVMVASASNYPLFSLNADKSLTDGKQLAGKTVAITSAGSSSEAVAKIFLHHFALEGQVKLQPSGQIQGVLAALEKGNAAGAVLSPPSTDIAAAEGFPELINGPKLGEPMVHGGVGVTRDYLKTHPEIVKAMLQGYVEGWQYMANPANEAAAEQILMKWTQTDQQVAQESYRYIFPIWSGQKVPTVDPKAIANILTLVSTNPQAKEAKPEQFFDNSLLQALGS